jgi:hypothetical protein
VIHVIVDQLTIFYFTILAVLEAMLLIWFGNGDVSVDLDAAAHSHESFIPYWHRRSMFNTAAAGLWP